MCSDLLIHGITVKSRVNSNNDGIDIDACENVRISDCNISSGDDAIVLKSTLNHPCANITISNCIISSDCNGFKLGTESSGDFRNITFSNCVIYNTRLAAIALEMVDGGTMRNVIVSDVNIDSAGCSVFIRLGNRARPFTEGTGKPGMGKLSDIMITGIQATRTGVVGCSVTGLPGSPVTGILMRDIRIETCGGGSSELFTREIKELPDKYPEFSMFGKLPAYGFYIRHAIGLTMEGVELKSRITDGRPPIVIEDVHDARISGINASFSEDYELPLIIRGSTDIRTADLSKIR
jgi:polygalacturonase